ncbi:sensor histidine kinase [Yoonia sp. R2331]|uniref:sensor histidine kinase n=1 Tax=Yoonia sp. R2331 TaxID=3237238 RepID=UPI0034E3FD08
MTHQAPSDALRILRIEDAAQRRREVALRASDIGVFEFDPATQETFWDDRVREIWGVSADEPTNYDLVLRGVHPEDHALHDAETARALDPANDGHLDISYRLYPLDGAPMRWVRAVADCIFEDGKPVRLVGTVRDITAEKRQEQQMDMLLYELEHRVKNTLSTAIAVMDLSRTGHTDVDSYYRATYDRLRAVALSHDSLRRGDWSDVELFALFKREAAAFLGQNLNRVTLEGDPVRIPARQVMTVSMAFHELLTNAAKYGALSDADGHVSLSARVADNRATLRWVETRTTKAAIDAEGPRGFGNILLLDILPAELQADVSRDVPATGLTYTLNFPLETTP